MKLKFLYFAILFLFISGCSQDPDCPSGPIETVGGNIFYSNMNVFEKGIWIRAYEFDKNNWLNNTLKPVNTTQIQENGLFSMNLPPGKYLFELYSYNYGFSKIYYGDDYNFYSKKYKISVEDAEQPGVILKSQEIIPEPKLVVLDEGNILQDINFDLDKGGKICGKVLYKDNNTPAQEAMIYAVLNNIEVNSTITNEEGEYTLCSLQPGMYKIYAKPKKTDYIKLYYPDKYNIEDASIIDIDDGDTIKDRDILLINGRTISGNINNEDDNQPIKDVTIIAYGDNNYSLSAISNEDGSYSITGLPPGYYKLFADASKPKYASEYYLNAFIINNARNVDVYSKQKETVNFNLLKPGKISGTVQSSTTGEPMAGLTITAFMENSTYSKTAVTNIDGAYTINDLQRGIYSVKVKTQNTNYSEYAPEYYDNKDGIELPSKVTVYDGNITPFIDFDLSIGGIIEGTVRNSNFQPVGGVKLIAYDLFNRNFNSTGVSSVNGRYFIRGLTNGNYKIQVIAPNYNYYISKYYDDKLNYSQANIVKVIKGQTEPNIDFTLDEGGLIKGQVLSESDNYPLSGITVQAIEVSSLYNYETITDKYGKFQFNGLPLLDYILFAKENSEYISQYYYNTDDIDKADPITVEKNEDYDIEFSLFSKGGISGNVIFSSESSIDYSITNLNPGSYHVKLKNHFEQQVDVLTNVNVLAGQETEDVNFDVINQ